MTGWVNARDDDEREREAQEGDSHSTGKHPPFIAPMGYSSLGGS